jgi:DNA-directed RNA polymerase subunit L
MAEFLNYKIVNGISKFELKSDSKNPIDKSIVNGIRRTILTELPTVGVLQDNIYIDKNETSLHNEFMKHRLSMIPFDINPENYNNDYMICLDVINITNNIQTITTEDFKIYSLKSEFKGKEIEIDKSNYDMSKEISKNDKKKILNPYVIEDITSYIIITELKPKTSDDDYQSLKLHLFPTVDIGYNNSSFNNISTCSYSFKEDTSLLNKMIEEEIKIKEFKNKKEIDLFKKEFVNKYHQRYYYRNNQNEPYWYNFVLKSNHKFKPKKVFRTGITILVDKLNRCINNLKLIITDPEKSRYSVSIEKNKSIKFIMDQENDTLGNIIQSHIVNNISDDSFITVCGYKKIHPLEEKIQLLVHTNILDDIDNISIINKTIMAVVNNIDEIINILEDLIKSFDSL